MIKYEEETISLEAELPDYSKYFLNNNPFFSIPAAMREGTRILVDRKRELETIQTAIIQTIKTDKRTSVLLEGIYGSGKSHLLFKFLDEVRKTLMAREGTRALGAYVTPGSRFLDFYSNLIENIGLQVLQSIVRKLEYELGTSERGQFVKVLEKEGIEPEFATAMSYMTYKYEYARTWRWLQGQKLTTSERTSIGVSENLDTEETALIGYTNLRKLMRKAGYQVLCIFFDELEKVTDQSSITSITRYLDSIRHLIDRDPGGLCLITTVTPAGIGILRSRGEALYRRLIMHGHYPLRGFSDDDAIQILGLHLQNEREIYLKKHKGERESLKERVEQIGTQYLDTLSFPFSYEGIKAINKKADGKVSDILLNASILIEKGAKDGKLYIKADDVISALGEETKKA